MVKRFLLAIIILMLLCLSCTRPPTELPITTPPTETPTPQVSTPTPIPEPDTSTLSPSIIPDQPSSTPASPPISTDTPSEPDPLEPPEPVTVEISSEHWEQTSGPRGASVLKIAVDPKCQT